MLDYIRELDHQLLIFINQLGNTGWDSFWLTIMELDSVLFVDFIRSV